MNRKTDNLLELQRQYCGGSGSAKEVSITRACYNVEDIDVSSNEKWDRKKNTFKSYKVKEDL